MDNKFIRFLVSMPIIILFLFFIPILGIVLIILRFIIYKNASKNRNLTFYLIGTSIVLLLPKLIYYIFKIFKVDYTKIPYFEDVINSKIYNVNVLKFCKFLIILGVSLLIVYYVLSLIIKKLDKKVRDYIKSEDEKDYRIRQENDLKMRENKEKIKNTRVVKCPNCGANNIVNEHVNVCKHCRSPLIEKK